MWNPSSYSCINLYIIGTASSSTSCSTVWTFWSLDVWEKKINMYSRWICKLCYLVVSIKNNINMMSQQHFSFNIRTLCWIQYLSLLVQLVYLMTVFQLWKFTLTECFIIQLDPYNMAQFTASGIANHKVTQKQCTTFNFKWTSENSTDPCKNLQK